MLSPESNLKSAQKKWSPRRTQTVRVSSTKTSKKKTGNISSPTSGRKLPSTCERFIKEKKQEKSKHDEAKVKRKEVEETSAKIKGAAFAL